MIKTYQGRSFVRSGWRLSTFIVFVFCSGCALWPAPDPSGHGDRYGRIFDGLAVGVVVNQSGSKALKGFERRRYADQIAAQILVAHPELDGKIDSYNYVSTRIGDGFVGLVEGFRESGVLEPRQRVQLRESKLRRRYLMLVGISPIDEKVELPPIVRPVPRKYNGEVADYELVRYQTTRIKTVQMQIYDTVTGRLLLNDEISSADGGKIVVNERVGKRYSGNSLVAALSNSLGNKLRYGDAVDYPAPPTKAHTLNYIWQLIAESVPSRVTS